MAKFVSDHKIFRFDPITSEHPIFTGSIAKVSKNEKINIKKKVRDQQTNKQTNKKTSKQTNKKQKQKQNLHFFFFF